MSDVILPGKGVAYQRCNRTACQTERYVTYYNIGSNAWYCVWCAREINKYSPPDQPLCSEVLPDTYFSDLPEQYWTFLYRNAHRFLPHMLKPRYS